jgi:hypothetical protein
VKAPVGIIKDGEDDDDGEEENYDEDDFDEDEEEQFKVSIPLNDIECLIYELIENGC